MNDILNSILVNLGLTTILIGIATYILKQSLTGIINLKVDEKLAKRKLEIELKKEKELEKIRQTGILYPKVLETTYRLRNEIRNVTQQLATIKNNSTNNLYNAQDFNTLNLNLLTNKVDDLEELLYKTKAHLSPEIQERVHDFKNHVKQLELNLNNLKLEVNNKKSIDDINQSIAKIIEGNKDTELKFSEISGEVKSVLNT
ncbi:hypothetical protein [Lacinutrix chionoecetis]